MSNFKVFLSPVAEKKLTNLLEYILVEWGVKSRNKFLMEFEKNIRRIEKYPKSCPESKTLGLYKNVINKQTSFYYQINKKEIEILTITDNRQDPKSILKEVKSLVNIP